MILGGANSVKAIGDWDSRWTIIEAGGVYSSMLQLRSEIGGAADGALEAR